MNNYSLKVLLLEGRSFKGNYQKVDKQKPLKMETGIIYVQK